MPRRAAKTFQAPKPSKAATTVNREGYRAFEQPKDEALLQCLLTNTMGGAFYANQKELVRESDRIHSQVADEDPKFYAGALTYARNKGFMRTQPVFGLVKLSALSDHGDLFCEAFNQVVRTPNDLNDFFTILRSKRKGEGGRRVKKIAGNWLMSRLNEYWAIKYGAKKQGSYSLRDLFCTLHPKGDKSVIVDYFFDRAKPEELPKQLAAFELLKRATSDASKVEAITAGRLPHEVASSFAGSSSAVWEAIVTHMPVFAMLRNLATMERQKVMPAVRNHVIRTLTDKKVITKSMILPFRFLEAMNHVSDAKVKDALRDALDLSFVNVPEMQGRLSVFIDISGSMGAYIQQAAVFGVSAMKKADLNGRVLLFDTAVEDFSVSKRDSTLSQAAKIQVRGGTDTSAPLRVLINERYKCDMILLITDEQQNTGSPFVNTLEEYRNRVCDKTKCVIMNVGPYGGGLSGQLIPHDPRGLNAFCYGWSDQALTFASMFSQGWKSYSDAVRSGKKADEVLEEAD